jgi:anti-anti-sigma factor
VLDLLGTIEAAELPDGRYLVSAHGPLDARIAHLLHETVVPLAAADGVPLILDLVDAHGIDDETLAVVSHAAHLANRRGGQLSIVTRSRAITGLVQDSGLDDIVTLFPTLHAALEL